MQSLSSSSSSSSGNQTDCLETIVDGIIRYNNIRISTDEDSFAKRELISKIFRYYSPNNPRFSSQADAMDWLSNDFGLYICFNNHCLFHLQEEGDAIGVQLWYQIDAFTSCPCTDNIRRQTDTHEQHLRELIQALPLPLLSRLQDQLQL